MIPFLGLLKSEKFWIAIGVVVILATGWLMILDYGQKRYDAGVADEKAIWVEAMAQAEDRVRNAEQALAEDRAQRLADNQAREAERVRLYNQARTQIHEAPDLESRLRALDSFRRSLHDAGAEDLARARADYLSSIAPDA